MKPKPTKLLLIGALSIVSSLSLQAANIVWTGGSGGTGTDFTLGANWLGGVAPASSITTDTALFLTNTIGQPTLNANRSVRGIDLTTNGWTLSGNAALMLGAGGITASNQLAGTNTVSITSLVMGSSSIATWNLFGTASGVSSSSTFNLSSSISLHPTAQIYFKLLRASSGGFGTLNLTGPITNSSTGGVKYQGTTSARNTVNIVSTSSTYSAPTYISQVTLTFDQLANDGSSSSFGSSGAVTLGDNNSIAIANYLGAGGATDRQWMLSGAGGGSIRNNGSGPISFNSAASAVSGTSGNRRLDLGGTNTDNNVFAGLLANNGGFTSFNKNDAGTWALANPNNSYTGTNTLNAGTLQVSKLDLGGLPSCIGASSSAAQNLVITNATLAYTGSGDTSDRLFQMNGSGTINNDGSGVLNLTGSGPILQAFTGTRTLTLGGSYADAANTFSPSLTDNGASAVSLTKKGAGIWIVAGANTYSGATTVSAGTLLVNGSLSSSPVSVQSGATLGGNGTIGGPVTVQDGGTLALGDLISTLTINNTLTLGGASTTVIKLSKSGVALSSDLVQGVSTLSYGGTLNVTASGDALTAGDTFQLFNAAAYSGAFTTINLPVLGAGLAWDTSGLTANGTIQVVSSGSPLTVTILPAVTNVECGSSVTFKATATGDPTPTLQWYDNSGSAIQGATSDTLTLNNVHPAQNGSWTVVAANSSGAATNSASLIVSDTTAPAITCPANISVVTADPSGANVSFTVSATDTCDGSVTVVSTPPSGSLFAAGTNTVISTVADSSGNTNTCSFLVIVDRAPVVQTNLSAALVQDQTLVLELTNLLAVASDPDNDPLSVMEAGPTSTNGGMVTLTATNLLYQPVAGYVGADLLSYVIGDGRGGLATNSVAVQVYSSNVLSVTVVPASTNAECGSSVSFTAQTSSELTPSFQWYDNAGNAIAGATSASLSLSDVHAAQNGSWAVVMANSFGRATNSASLMVTDTAAPVITLNGTDPITIECHSLFSDPGATALDACVGSVTVSVSGSVNVDVLGLYTLTYTADDGNGNVSQKTRTVRVVDTTPPTIACPSTISVVTTDPAGATVNFTVTATDSSDPNPTVVSSPASGALFAPGTNTVISTATDISGNSSTCSFLIIVDRAPVPQGSMHASVLQNQPLTIGLAKLLALVSDPDNDPLTVTAAGPASTNGASVTLNSSTVTYLPVTNYVGADLFSYTVSDGRGGFATNTVMVNVASSNGLSPNVVFGPVMTNGQFVVRFAGIPGFTYTIQGTEDMTNWTKKANVTAPSTDQGLGVGIFEFSESVGTAPMQFYRTAYPSY